MKILKLKPWKYTFDCSGCGSKLEAEESDVKHGQFGSMGDYEREYYVECPLCKTCHKLKWGNVPAKVRNK